MEPIAHLLQAIAALAWPAVALVLLSKLSPTIAALFETAKTRKFTIKIGGQELTMDEVNQQARGLIADLQTRVLELEHRVAIAPLESARPDSSLALEAPKLQRHLLWVDDNPKNNSFLVQELSDQGVRVDLSISTHDGLLRIASNGYDVVVVSDMGRDEDGISKPTAGLELLREARAKGFEGPILFFTSGSAARRHLEEVRRLGGNGITSSPTELRGLILRHLHDMAG